MPCTRVVRRRSLAESRSSACRRGRISRNITASRARRCARSAWHRLRRSAWARPAPPRTAPPARCARSGRRSRAICAADPAPVRRPSARRVADPALALEGRVDRQEPVVGGCPSAPGISSIVQNPSSIVSMRRRGLRLPFLARHAPRDAVPAGVGRRREAKVEKTVGRVRRPEAGAHPRQASGRRAPRPRGARQAAGPEAPRSRRRAARAQAAWPRQGTAADRQRSPCPPVHPPEAVGKAGKKSRRQLVERLGNHPRLSCAHPSCQAI